MVGWVFKVGCHFIVKVALTHYGTQIGLKLIANLLPQPLCAGITDLSHHTHHFEGLLNGSNHHKKKIVKTDFVVKYRRVQNEKYKAKCVTNFTAV